MAAILIAASILLVGNGLQNTLLSVRANFESFSLLITGLLMSAYYVGFILGCRLTPSLVIRVGHIRSFTALASVSSAIALMHVLFVEPVSWVGLRAISGFCFAGMTMILESWMNEKATNENRGSFLSIYRVIDFSATTLGQWLLTLADPKGFALFAAVSVLISVALVPVAMTTIDAPRQLNRAGLNLKKLFAVSPLSAVGTFAVGCSNGAFWAIGPVFVIGLGYSVQETASFMSLVILAGAVSQWPLGRFSDIFDRRKVIIAVGLGACVAGVVGFLLAAQSVNFLLLSAGLFGCFALPLFGLCVAHANDFAAQDEYVEINGGLLLLYGVGAVFAPLMATMMINLVGPSSLFLHTALVHGLFTLYGMYRMTQRATRPAEEQEKYVPVPRTSPIIFQLDPRTPEKESDSSQ